VKRVVVWMLAGGILAGLGWGAFRLWDERRFATAPFGEGTRTIVIPPGSGPRTVAALLVQGGAISDADRFVTHMRFFRRGQRPRAGEYEFVGPVTPDEVLARLARGEVKLYRFTVPEGLRLDEIAPVVGATGVCDASEFLALARDPATARKLGVPASSLEGYLFPDTYSVPRGLGCAGIAQAMVARFRIAWDAAEKKRKPGVKLTQPQAVTLASIIEKETGRADERPRISCVFHNRLAKRMRLGTDPTVIYATLLANDFKWDGKIHKSDLQREHPYNTYVVFGLPPGPIASAGAAALEAALNPIECGDYYFVSRNDGSHVFCPDLECHERNVQKWQVEYFRKRKQASR